MLAEIGEKWILRVMLGVTIVALAAVLFVVRTGAAPVPPDPSQGNPQVLAQIAALQGQVEGLAEDHIRDHLQNPFDISVDVCANIGGAAGLEAALGLEVPVTLEGMFGLEFYGSGVKIKSEPEGAASLGGTAGADVDIALSACFNGISVLQEGDPTPDEELVLAALEDGATEAGDAIRSFINTVDVSSSDLGAALTALKTMSFEPDPLVLLDGGLGATGLGGLFDTLPLNSSIKTLLEEADQIVVPQDIAALLPCDGGGPPIVVDVCALAYTDLQLTNLQDNLQAALIDPTVTATVRSICGNLNSIIASLHGIVGFINLSPLTCP